MPAEISRGKRALFYAIVGLVAYALVEAGSLVLHYATQRSLPSPMRFEAERRAVLAATERIQAPEVGAVPTGFPPGSIYEVLHPYLGFVLDPTRTPGFSEYGFPDEDVRIFPKDPSRVVIGIFGGSFAHGFANNTKSVLAATLAKSARFAGKDIKVLAVATGGYKQPQQLFALAWLISLGAHFDYVVSLDGFNEVVLPVTDNLPKRVSPFYPRNWYGRMNAFDSRLLAIARDYTRTLEERQAWARLFSQVPLRYSFAANVAWKARDTALESRLRSLNVAAVEARPREDVAIYSVRGPRFQPADEAALYDELARMWKESSLQMKALAGAKGMTYLHFLQPNQYVPGSKEMGPEERKAAFDDAHPYRRSVVMGYPRLIERGRELRAQGVEFQDLTRIFVGRKEPLYTDTCCHLSAQGYAILAAEIAEKILQAP